MYEQLGPGTRDGCDDNERLPWDPEPAAPEEGDHYAPPDYQAPGFDPYNRPAPSQR